MAMHPYTPAPTPTPPPKPRKYWPFILAGTLVVIGGTAVAVGLTSSDTTAKTETTDPARAAECEELLQKEGGDESSEAPSCRLDGHDPVWNAISIYTTDEDYEHWRKTGDLPTCADINGRDNPLGGKYNEADVTDCEAYAAGEEAPEREGEFDTTISDAAAECGVDDNVGDEGDSISFDTEGEEDYSGDDISEVACVLSELDTPDHVINRIDGTRALDGTLDAEWDDYAAFWTYHPDDGMNLTVYRVEGGS